MSSTVSLENIVATASNLLHFVFSVQIGDWELSHRFLRGFGWIQMVTAVALAGGFFAFGSFCPELGVDVFPKAALFAILLILTSLLLLGWQALEIASLDAPRAPVSCSLDDHWDCRHELCRVAAMNQLPVVYRGLGYWTLAIAMPAFPFLLAALDWGPHTTSESKVTYAIYLSVLTFVALVYSLFGIFLRVHSPFSTPNSILVRFILWTEKLRPTIQEYFHPSMTQKDDTRPSENTPLINT